MGLFGAMFAVATVIGPLIGGLCVTYLSWRWVFYINLPLGILALFVTGAVLPGHLRRVSHRIDYAGALLLAGSATALILFASLGGISWAWASLPSIACAVVGVLLAVAFLFAEKVAAEPVIPLKLYRVRVFNAASSIGFVMGFAMFGALTFLPLFMQNVKGVSPTASGLRILPLMVGMLGASVVSGRLVTRWGRYKVFPVVGTALMTVGAYLLSLIDASTNNWVLALYMFVFGVGMGLIMQVLVVAVQNSVSYEDLGVATSSATFFRMIGGSFGTAVFGAIYTIVFTHTLAPTLAKVPASILRSFNPQTINPAILDKLKSTAEGLVFYGKYIDAVTHSVQVVFLVAVPISFLAFLLSFLLPEVELRKTVQTVDLGEVQGAPQSPLVAPGDPAGARAGVGPGEPRRAVPHPGPTSRHRPAAAVVLAALPAGRPARRERDGGRAAPQDRPGAHPAGRRRAGGRRHDRGAAARCPVRPAPDGRGQDRARQADRSQAERADRAARGVEPRGASRDHRDGEGTRACAPRRRRTHGGRRHAAHTRGRRRGDRGRMSRWSGGGPARLGRP